MQIIRNINNLSNIQACVATIGNFDGMHLGHQSILHHVIAQSKVVSLPSTVIFFEPQPQEFFMQHQAPARLTNLREKLNIIKKLGIERVLILRFSSRCITMAAEEFVERILVNALKVKFLFVGDDFRFGKWRRGDFNLLRLHGDKYGFVVENTTTVYFAGERISSTRIRHALQRNDFTMVKNLLGRSYQLCGKVRHGAKRGRLLGFPTANLYLKRKISPINGVYAVRVFGPHDKIWTGVANVGSRPTIMGDNRVTLETYIFDFNSDIYHNYISVEPVQKIREERRFANLEELQQQIARDVAYVRGLQI